MDSKKYDYLTTLLLCLTFGVFGAHRFYVNKIGTAVLMIVLTLSTFGIASFVWMVYDLITICEGDFVAKDGTPLYKHPKIS